LTTQWPSYQLLLADSSLFDLAGRIFYFLPDDIQIVVFFSALFFVLGVCFFIFILISRFFKNARERKVEELKKRYMLLITSVIFNDTSIDYESIKQRRKLLRHFRKNYLRSSFNRSVLVEEIIKLQKEITGKPAQNLRELYLDLGLNKHSLSKLRSWRWHIKAKGVQEVADMKLQEAYPNVYRLLNHRNPILRMEVQLALVRLVRFDALRFLDDSRYPISEWQQLHLLNILSSFDTEELPDFSKWLQSKNESVVLFAFKLIVYFTRIDLTKEVIRMLKHPSLKIRRAAVETIGELDAASALSLLKKQFYLDEKEFKMEVLKVSGKIAIEKDLAFLELQLLSEDQDISLASASALAENGEGGVEMLKDIYGTYADDKLKAIINHVFNNMEG
jgi:hypothetical protein